MTWDEILQRIALGEDEQTEFKTWSGDLEKVARSVCAMANGIGGLVVLGVNDDGRLVGVPGDPEGVAEQLTSLLHTGLNAPVSARVRRSSTDAVMIHWLEILPWRGPAPLERKGRVYVRRGRSTVEPSDSEVRDLFNKLGFVLTEEQFVPGTSASDLDPQVFRDFLAAQQLDVLTPPQPTLDDDMRSRELLAHDGETLRATVYGLLCFGRSPQLPKVLHNAKVVMTAFAGVDRADRVTVTGEALGRVDEQVERVEGWMRSLPHRERWEGTTRIDVPPVPPRALREAVVNAVAHRDYAITSAPILVDVFTDRLEVTSPGALPNHLSVQSVLAGGLTRSRNEALANYLVVRGKMEKRGRGLPIIRSELRAVGAGEPRLENDRESRSVRLVLPLTP